MLNKILIGILFSVVSLEVVQAGDYYGHQQNLNGLKAQIKILNQQIDRFILERKTTTDEKRKAEIIEQIIALQEEFVIETEKYNNEVTHMRFYHPEKGDPEILVYKRKEIKNLSPYALEEGVDALLSEAIMSVEDKFGDPDLGSKSSSQNRGPASSYENEKEELSTLERIILKK